MCQCSVGQDKRAEEHQLLRASFIVKFRDYGVIIALKGTRYFQEIVEHVKQEYAQLASMQKNRMHVR